MIYKNENIPVEFNKIIDFSDNYIVWVKDSFLISDNKYEAYIQYLNPSFSYIYIDDYVITDGNKNSLLYTYESGEILSANIIYGKSSIVVDSNFVSGDNDLRSDSIPIFWGQIGCVICILWVFKQLSRLFVKGGLY